MEDKQKEKIVNPFEIIALIILPFIFIYTLYKGYNRCNARDIDAGISYFIASVFCGLAIFFFIKKLKNIFKD